MKIFDISWPISTAATAYKDKKTVSFQETKQFATDKVRETIITLGSHTGTHVDAPSHFLEQGISIDQLELSSLIGPCTVLDCTDVTVSIGKEYLQKKINFKTENILLFKTTNSFLSNTDSFNPNFIFLDQTGAQWCVENNIKTVGIDYLGIERGQAGHPTHKELFNNNLAIIEGLRLAEIREDSYWLICLPLRIVGLDAAPARAILFKN